MRLQGRCQQSQVPPETQGKRILPASTDIPWLKSALLQPLPLSSRQFCVSVGGGGRVGVSVSDLSVSFL